MAIQTSVRRTSALMEVLWVFTRLGFTSFGGPVAHLGYFREELVVRRKWVDEATYADIVALCQFLPGPTSSQVGISLGMARAGMLGGFAAWLGFTMPSAVALILFAIGVTTFGDVTDAGWLRGLKIVAVPVVAIALWGMAQNLCPDKQRITLAIIAAFVMLIWATAVAQIAVIAAAGLAGWVLLREGQGVASSVNIFPFGRRIAIASLAIFFGLLIALPILSQTISNDPLAIFDSFYRSGSLVFGGGHVVLPLLQAEVVPPGWVTNDEFIAGYGAAQAVPGPLFTFSAYLGTVSSASLTSWAGGFFALAAIFLPSFLLVIGTVPFWDRLRSIEGVRSALRGINAGVVGLLLAALYNPVWTSAIHNAEDFAIGIAAFGLLAFWKWPPWLVVILAALTGEGITRFL